MYVSVVCVCVCTCIHVCVQGVFVFVGAGHKVCLSLGLVYLGCWVHHNPLIVCFPSCIWDNGLVVIY